MHFSELQKYYLHFFSSTHSQLQLYMYLSGEKNIKYYSMYTSYAFVQIQSPLMLIDKFCTFLFPEISEKKIISFMKILKWLWIL